MKMFVIFARFGLIRILGEKIKDKSKPSTYTIITISCFVNIVSLFYSNSISYELFICLA